MHAQGNQSNFDGTAFEGNLVEVKIEGISEFRIPKSQLQHASIFEN